MAISIGGALLGAAGISAAAGIAGGLMQQNNKPGDIGRTVRQAKAAGIHPLYALGQPTMGSWAPSGSALGEGIQNVARAASGGLKQYAAHKVDQAAIESGAPQAEANLAYTLAQTDSITQATAASRLAVMMQRTNQTGYGREAIEAQPLDMSQVTDPATGRVVMTNTPAGWHYLDPNVVPQRTFEDEYGEIGEIYGVGRYAASKAYGGRRRGAKPNWSKYYE